MNCVKAQILPDEISENLKCLNCNLYLSVTPIYVVQDGLGYVCGRCEVPENAIHLQFCESLFKILLFKCSYASYGCSKLLTTDIAKVHEEHCEFAPIVCPERFCNTIIFPRLIEKHFMDSHKECAISDKFYSNDLIDYKNYILIKNNNIYILQIHCNGPLLYFSVNYLNTGSSNTSEERKYNFIIKAEHANKNRLVREHFVKLYNKKIPLINSMDSINIEDLKRILYCNSLEFTIKLDVCHVTKQEFEEYIKTCPCPICFNYIGNEIIECNTGHIFCKNCRSDLRCPICKKPCRRNNDMEKIMNLMNDVNCFNNGCDFKGSPYELKNHSSNCKMSHLHCPLMEFDCHHSGDIRYLAYHLNTDHDEYIRHHDHYLQGKYPQEGVWSRIYFQYDKVFKLNFKYDEKFRSYCMQELRNVESYEPEYIYCVEFHDPYEKGLKMVLSGKCYCVPKNGDKFYNACTISSNMILPFVRNGEFMRKVTIVKTS